MVAKNSSAFIRRENRLKVLEVDDLNFLLEGAFDRRAGQVYRNRSAPKQESEIKERHEGYNTEVRHQQYSTGCANSEHNQGRRCALCFAYSKAPSPSNWARPSQKGDETTPAPNSDRNKPRPVHIVFRSIRRHYTSKSVQPENARGGMLWTPRLNC